MPAASLEDLIKRAELAERIGGGSANALWDQLVAVAPEHSRALYIQGRRLVERGQAAAALGLLTRAEALDPIYPEIPLYTALAHRMLGALPEAIGALDRALARDPYFFLALLSKGAVLDQLGKPKQAAQVYKNAIKIAPPPERLAPSLRGALERAQAGVAANAGTLADYLRAQTPALRTSSKGADLDRFQESIDILAGAKPRYVHDPALLNYPRLPAIPFFDRDYFPWLGELEASAAAIASELNEVLREDMAKFAPYIQYPKGARSISGSNSITRRRGVRISCGATASARTPIARAAQKPRRC